MASENVFIPLVKHELKWRRNLKKNRRRMPRAWRLVYASFFIILVLGLTTYGSLHGHIQYEGSWYFTWGLPFMIFALSIHSVRREWQNETVGWWLSLPFSRTQLVTAKFVASALRGLIISVFIYILMILFTLYIFLLKGSFQDQEMIPFLISGLKWFLLLIAVSPIAASVGTLMGIMTQTKARPAIPIFWVLFWVMFPLYGFHTIGSHVAGPNHLSFLSTSTIIVPIFISWILTFLLIRVSAYLLEKQLTL